MSTVYTYGAYLNGETEPKVRTFKYLGEAQAFFTIVCDKVFEDGVDTEVKFDDGSSVVLNKGNLRASYVEEREVEE